MEREIIRKNIKTCTKCNEELTLDKFSKNKTNKDGLQSWCKKCISQYKIDRKERYREYYKNYYIKNKEYFKNYKSINKHNDLYIVFDGYNNIKYVGSTIESVNVRMSKHKVSKRKASEYVGKVATGEENGKILFIRLDNLNLSEIELRYIEQCFIDKLRPSLNKNKACSKYDLIDNDRLIELNEIAINLIDNFSDVAITYIDRCYAEQLDQWLIA